MFRHLPILLIIFASTRAHAEPGFFEQLLDSLKSKTATTTSEPAGEPADSIASEPLALQPTTTTRRHNQKRSRASRRHPVSAPLRQPEARIGSPPASSKNTGRSSAAEPAVPPELINDSKPVESVLPWENQSNVLPSPTVWPAPAPVAPGPDESSRVESAQGDPPRGLQAEAQPKAEDDARPDATEVAQQAEPEPFLDSQRVVLAGFSAAWLGLGIGMFVFRRQLAKALNARPRQQSYAEMRHAPRALTVILRNAARDSTVAENGGGAERRAVAAG